MDNSKNRLQEVFFYGLYMDEEILKSKGVSPRNPRAGKVNGYKLRVGKMATLLRVKNCEAYGMVYSLTYDEINKLYRDSGLIDYVAESVIVQIGDTLVASLCCNLLNPPSDDESNEEYFNKLKICMEKYNLPTPTEV
ncbi:gamma-glutamylcyclotransferase family protein [Arcobacter sp. LA11]|uniref:gamma-glutamylcyclotransferase family protein n=1 Tax=Arcobacter sp. LA11 TaxID=1898176 RepID=UPI000932AE31|nr:gamma-glutamylcyclotransferase family protein [Arcobacter sp. LA11]